MLRGKKIVLGVTGSIAAYKAAILVRGLMKEGCEVKIIMTALSKEFITPLTLATLSGNPILVDFFNPENGEWNSHVKLSLWADCFLIAPATANTIAKMANGVADNLLLTTYLSSRAPVFIAPAMDYDMFLHPANRRNLERLKDDGVNIIEPGDGFLASGLLGKGRMEEPENIIKYLDNYFSIDKPLKGKKALITAGGTRESIDPVRCITNHSTGKMGYAIANRLVEMGADVTIIKASIDPALSGSVKMAQEIEAMSAAQMYSAVSSIKDQCDIIVMSAAVSDYTPKIKSDVKIKKHGSLSNLTIELEETKDIAAFVGNEKRDNQILVGFALETNDEFDNAIKKLVKKNLDFIVLNSLNDKGAGFATDTNKITIISKDGKTLNGELKSKNDVANDIVDQIILRIKE